MSRLSLNNLIEYIEKNDTFLKKEELFDKIEEEEKFEASKLNKKQRLLSFNKETLDSIFCDYLEKDKFYRQGMIKSITNPKNKNISLISSLLFCLYKDFELDPVKKISGFIRKFISDSPKKFIDNNYSKLGWVKKEFLEDIRKTNITKMYMRYLSDYFKINLFLVDLELDTLYYIGEKNLIPYKINIFIIKLEDQTTGDVNYEPIFTKNKKNHVLMRKLLNSKFLIEYMDCDFTNDDEDLNFTIEREDLTKYLENITENTDNTNSDSNSDSFDDDSDEDDKFDEEEDKFDESDIDSEKYIGNKNVRLRDGITDIPTFTEDNDSIDSENIDTKFLVDDMTIKTEQKELKKLNEDDSDNDDSDNEEENKIIAKKSMKVTELKKIAKDIGIKLSYIDKKGKKKNKTKDMLINEINNNQD